MTEEQWAEELFLSGEIAPVTSYGKKRISEEEIKENIRKSRERRKQNAIQRSEKR